MKNIFDILTPKANLYLKDKEKLKELIKKASKKALTLTDKDKRSSLIHDLKFIILLLKDWVNGNYKKIPKKSLISAIIAIIYFVLPTDFIPDFIIGTGFLDDAAVLSYMIALMKNDLKDYILFKEDESKRKKSIKNYTTAIQGAFDGGNRREFSQFIIPIVFFKKNKNDYISFFKKYTKNKKGNINNNLLYYFIGFTLKNYELNDSEFFKSLDQTTNIKDEDTKNTIFFFSYIVKKICLGEKDKTQIFTEHNYELLNFNNIRTFNISKFKFSNKKELCIGNDDIINIIESVFIILNNSNNYDELINNTKEGQVTDLVRCTSTIIGSLYFENTKIDIYPQIIIKNF